MICKEFEPRPGLCVVKEPLESIVQAHDGAQANLFSLVLIKKGLPDFLKSGQTSFVSVYLDDETFFCS